MFDTPGERAIAISLLLIALVGLFVWYGSLDPDPALNEYPGADELGADDDAFVGQQASLGGTVVATEPVVIEVSHDYGTDRYTVRNAPPVEEDQELRVFATVEPDNTLVAHETIVRDQWERTYMWAVSILAALWVFGRTLRHWRPDPERLAFRPRHHGDDRDG